jgi:hypothetical protein
MAGTGRWLIIDCRRSLARGIIGAIATGGSAMKKKLGLALLAAAALTACSHHSQRISDRMAEALHANPVLTVRGPGLISVAPEPIVLNLKAQKEPIVWRVPSGYTFPVKDGKEGRDGIEILGLLVDSQGRPVPPGPDALKESGLALLREESRAFNCAPANKERTEFACAVNSSLVKKGVYRYAIRLLDKDGKLIEWDPNIFGME